MKSFRTRIVIALIVLVCGVSVIEVLHIINVKTEKAVSSSVVVSRPSPIAVPIQPMRSRGNLVTHAPIQNTSDLTHDYAVPSVVTSSSFRLYTTSSVHVQSVGGGSSVQGTANTSHGSSSRGISYSTAAMPMTTFVAMASSRQVAAPEAQTAPEMAQMAAAPRHTPGPPTITDPPEEHQLVEQPVTDALIPLLMLGIGYALLILLRRRKEI